MPSLAFLNSTTTFINTDNDDDLTSLEDCSDGYDTDTSVSVCTQEHIGITTSKLMKSHSSVLTLSSDNSYGMTTDESAASISSGWDSDVIDVSKLKSSLPITLDLSLCPKNKKKSVINNVVTMLQDQDRERSKTPTVHTIPFFSVKRSKQNKLWADSDSDGD